MTTQAPATRRGLLTESPKEDGMAHLTEDQRAKLVAELSRRERARIDQAHAEALEENARRNGHLHALEILAKRMGPVTFRARGNDWTTADGVRLSGRVIKDLEADGFLDFFLDTDPAYVVVQVTRLGRDLLTRRTAQLTPEVPFLPRRGDAVEVWLMTTLDRFPGTTAVDLLTLYRKAADAGKPLTDPTTGE